MTVYLDFIEGKLWLYVRNNRANVRVYLESREYRSAFDFDTMIWHGQDYARWYGADFVSPWQPKQVGPGAAATASRPGYRS